MTPQQQTALRAAQGARTTLDQIQRRAKAQQNRHYRERQKREAALAKREAAVQLREDAVGKAEALERFEMERLIGLRYSLVAGWSMKYLLDELDDILHELKTKSPAG